ncbi:S1 family peptidase [Bradyrhizobium sp. cf659]|uniref:S1 family peptidase n=1 Tax=Bradyrhizobium sp. cf659 TaxID=1761771 RepID=UPI0008ECA3A7|nr:serine protease [Bradyrhizobium sp. cf659]SFI16772.1 Trypsin-like peptidase domain-containing protein [Bradyrhizobium sp. cf659]
MAINEIMLTVSLVVQLKAGSQIGTASGFFYENNDKLFFVTNVHVVKGDKVVPDTLRIRLHTDGNDTTKNANYDIPLYDAANAPAWKTDLQSTEADVAVLQLDKAKLTQKFIVKAWSAANFLPKQYTMQPGEDVFIIGFPLGVSDFPHNLAVLRGGMVASAYGVPFQGKPLFLTDINLHPGTSGSPVVSKPKSTWVNQENGNTELTAGTNYYFLGVHSGTLDVKNPADGVQIGLGASWYAAIVQRIAEQFK